MSEAVMSEAVMGEAVVEKELDKLHEELRALREENRLLLRENVRLQQRINNQRAANRRQEDTILWERERHASFAKQCRERLIKAGLWQNYWWQDA